jgi:hypothetical protein
MICQPLYVKLPGHRPELPGHAVASRMRAKVVLFHIVPLDPASPALAGRGTSRPKVEILRGTSKNTGRSLADLRGKPRPGDKDNSRDSGPIDFLVEKSKP